MQRHFGRKHDVARKKETAVEKAQKDAQSSGLVECEDRKLSMYEQQRNARWARAQAELKAKRFTGPLMCGVADGPRENMRLGKETRLNTEGDLVEVPSYYGPGVVWVTLDDKNRDPDREFAGIGGGCASNGLVFRLWAEGRKQPSQESDERCFEKNIRRWDHTPFRKLRAQISSTALIAATFRLAEDHPDKWKSITRHEAELIVRFEECWSTGVAFLQHAKLIEHSHESERLEAWPREQQSWGMANYDWLIDCYGRGCFPCPEVVSIAAFYFCQREGDLPEWLTKDSSTWVAWMFLLGRKIWCCHGTNKTRNTLMNLPICEIDVAITEAEVIEARDEYFNYTVELYEEDEEDEPRFPTRLDMEQMSYISPIANQAVSPSVHIRNPRKMGPEYHRSPLYDAKAFAVGNAIYVGSKSQEDEEDEESRRNNRMETDTETATDWGSCCSSPSEDEDW
ncbi:unnamed protein product [Zymoseptoria tritici ST99CH_3D1]|nr:unnamed protein product [Zymoseptoria tritici ST99CH_3D1]